MAFKDLLKTAKLVEVPLAGIEKNPKNWRLHPPGQREALRELLGDVGIAVPMIGYKTADGKVRLIDGHARREEYEAAGQQSTSILILDVDEQTADKLLFTIDPISAMARADTKKTAELMKTVRVGGDAVAKMLAQVASSVPIENLSASRGEIVIKPVSQSEFYGGSVAAADDGTVVPHNSLSPEVPAGYLPPVSASSVVQVDNEVLFPSKNPWGIPEIDPEMLCETFPETTFALKVEDLPKTRAEMDKFLFIASKVAASKPPGGYLGFYTFDENFESAWNDSVEYAEKLRSQQWTGVLSPDFSTYKSDPPVVRLYNLYRARWVLRLWQQLGFKVIPSLQTAPRWIGLGPGTGLPKGIPVVSCQLRSGSTDKVGESNFKIFVREIAEAVEDLQPKVVLVYGSVIGKEVLSEFPAGPHYHLLPSFMQVRDEQRFPGRFERRKNKEI